MIIKVCGMRDADNIRAVEQLNIDYMGFIFWPKSSRFVSERPAYLPTNCKCVGVFVNETIEQVSHISDEYSLDYIQLHGNESPAFIQELKAKSQKPRSIIKAFNIAVPTDFEQTKAYEGIADMFLFDTKGKSVGGNGEKFDWNVLKAYKGETPFLLSGGIGPDDASCIKTFHHPQCIGIDLNSRFETAPGLKDISKLKTFINSL